MTGRKKFIDRSLILRKTEFLRISGGFEKTGQKNKGQIQKMRVLLLKSPDDWISALFLDSKHDEIFFLFVKSLREASRGLCF